MFLRCCVNKFKVLIMLLTSSNFMVLKCCVNKFKLLVMLSLILNCCLKKFKLLIVLFVFLKSMWTFWNDSLILKYWLIWLKTSNKKSMIRSITWKPKGKTKKSFKNRQPARTNKEKELIPLGVRSRKYVPLDIREEAVGEIASYQERD
jgi:hypothetical protein